MIVILAVIFRFTLRRSIVEQARKQADRGLLGKMEGHGAMDMSVSGGSFFRRLFSGRAFTSISHYFFMNVYSLWADFAPRIPDCRRSVRGYRIQCGPRSS